MRCSFDRLGGAPKTGWYPQRVPLRQPPVALQHVAKSWWFNAIVVASIVADSFLVGIETDLLRGGEWEDRMDFWIMDLLFSSVFLSEMLARMHQLRWEYFADSWNLFDYCCVCLSCTAVVQPMQNDAAASSDVLNLRLVKALKSFRLLRLLRVVRHIGGLKAVEGLWLLVAGTLKSVPTILWTALMLMIVCYFFACTLVVALDDPNVGDSWPDGPVYAGSVYKAMISVFQIVTFDAWASIARPVLEVAPLGGPCILGAIFVGSFGVLNVVLAVMVESIRTITEGSRKRTTKMLQELDVKVISRLTDDYRRFDESKKGELTHEQFSELMKDEDFAYKLRLLGIQFAEADQLFHLMDADQSGAVSPEEFVGGLQQLRGPALGKDMLKVICCAQMGCVKARRYVEHVRNLGARADVLQRRLNGMGHGILRGLDFQAEAKVRASEVRDRSKVRQRIIRNLRRNERVTFPENR